MVVLPVKTMTWAITGPQNVCGSSDWLMAGLMECTELGMSRVHYSQSG